MKTEQGELCLRKKGDYTIFLELDKVRYYGYTGEGTPEEIIKKLEGEYSVAVRQSSELKSMLIAYKQMSQTNQANQIKDFQKQFNK